MGSIVRRAVIALVAVASTARAQAPAAEVRAVTAPRTPLPSEAQSAGVTKFSFIAYGDNRSRVDGIQLQGEHGLVIASMQRTIAARANSADPVRFVVSSGDMVVNGRDAAMWNVSYVDLVNRLTGVTGIPFYPSPGNHDVTSSMLLSDTARQHGLRNYLSAFQQLIPADGSPHRLSGYPTYGFGYGNTFVLAMDSNIADDTVQFNWIRGQLAGLDRGRYRNVAIVLHHPAFSSGPHGGFNAERPTLAMRALYMPLFRKHHVRLVLAGHEHLFEHWVERYKDGGQSYRIDQIVSGGGGAPLYAYQGEPDLREYTRAASADSVRLEHLVKPGMNAWENPYHYVVVHVDGEKIRIEVIGVDFGAEFRPYRSRSVDLDGPVNP
ncbi:MAG: metallophosphoesterase [bacterium]